MRPLLPFVCVVLACTRVPSPTIPDGGGCSQLDFRPPPDARCNADRLDVQVCPEGLAGYGYSCAKQGCWAYFDDGPCAYNPFRDDPLPDGGPAAKYCTPVSSPYKPFEACTPALEGALRCGPDYGYRCVGGCWDFFFDGACAKPDA
jgi:hypothetical protein